jgi:hypothetical protein
MGFGLLVSPPDQFGTDGLGQSPDVPAADRDIGQ